MEKYDYEIAFCDRWLGKLLAAVEEAGLADDTAIVVMADHGEAWGEHKHYFHGQDLFEEQLRVPLIFVVPGQSAPGHRRSGGAGRRGADAARSGRREDSGGHARAQPAAAASSAQGGPPTAPRPIFAELLPATAWPHHAAMMVDADHKMIHRISDRRWELYDLKRDPQGEEEPRRRPGGRQDLRGDARQAGRLRGAATLASGEC